MDETHSEWRSRNLAWNHLVRTYSPMGPKLEHVANEIHGLADALKLQGENSARVLISSLPLRGGSPGKKLDELVSSIFDLQLGVFFNETASFLEDTRVTCVLLDALLHQVLGDVGGAPTEDEMFLGNTQSRRGIEKYVTAKREFSHMADFQGWVFGRECAWIMTDNAGLDFVSAASEFSVLVRWHARWIIQSSLLGTHPTEEERASEAKVKEAVWKRMASVGLMEEAGKPQSEAPISKDALGRPAGKVTYRRRL